MYLLTQDMFQDITDPIIKLIEQAVVPALGLVAAIGAVYCIILGAKLAKAEEPQEREKAKSALKNAVVGYFLIFVLLVSLKIAEPAMKKWYNEQKTQVKTTEISTTMMLASIEE